MKTVIVWFRNDLRIHDHPALHAAITHADHVIPIFIQDPVLLETSPNRTRFLIECLQDLRQSLQSLGSNLLIRAGEPADVLIALARQTNAEAIYCTADYTPYATRRDNIVATQLKTRDITYISLGGRLAVDDIAQLRTQSGTVYQIFTPFWRQWQRAARREVVATPLQITSPDIPAGPLPSLPEGVFSPHVLPGGETAARKRLHQFLRGGIDRYHQTNNDLAADATSRLSPYLHFGCLSVREIETLLQPGDGPAAWHRQLAWRDFYYYVLLHFPHPTQAFQKRYRSLQWNTNPLLLQAWQSGQTGYPIVDAAMRQLKEEGWMHNRARLIVGSFLTKDLGLHWQLGEAYFMHMLLDGDTANNNGNWQWIASVGVDPAPVSRRLYNPASQQKNYDSSGAYVRRYVPELAKVPDEYLAEPWRMPTDLQQQTSCIIGQDYPAPIVNHAEARQAALERYRSVSTQKIY